MKKRFMGAVGNLSGRFLVIIFFLSIPAALILPKLTNLVPVNSVFEQAGYLNIEGINDFVTNSLFAPIRLAMFGLLEIGNANIASLRLVSGICTALAALLLFVVLRQWHTNRIAAITTLMFLSSSWVLHAARSANVEVMYLLAFPGLMLIGTWITSKKHDNKLPLSMLLLATILYIPGAWVFAVAGLFIFRKHVIRIWRQVNTSVKLISVSLFMAAIAPLFYSFTQNRDNLVNWLGAAGTDSFLPKTILSNIVDIFRELFISGPNEPTRWLIGTPIFDVFTIAMLALGLYAYKVGLNPAREKMLFASIFIGVLLIIVGSTDHLGILIPILYLVIANGIAYMLQAWFAVFPRNPMARSLGLFIVFSAVALSCFYQMQRYYVAWPNAPSTKTIYNLKQQ